MALSGSRKSASVRVEDGTAAPPTEEPSPWQVSVAVYGGLASENLDAWLASIEPLFEGTKGPNARRGVKAMNCLNGEAKFWAAHVYGKKTPVFSVLKANMLARAVLQGGVLLHRCTQGKEESVVEFALRVFWLSRAAKPDDGLRDLFFTEGLRDDADLSPAFTVDRAALVDMIGAARTRRKLGTSQTEGSAACILFRTGECTAAELCPFVHEERRETVDRLLRIVVPSIPSLFGHLPSEGNSRPLTVGMLRPRWLALRSTYGTVTANAWLTHRNHSGVLPPPKIDDIRAFIDPIFNTLCTEIDPLTADLTISPLVPLVESQVLKGNFVAEQIAVLVVDSACRRPGIAARAAEAGHRMLRALHLEDGPLARACEKRLTRYGRATDRLFSDVETYHAVLGSAILAVALVEKYNVLYPLAYRACIDKMNRRVPSNITLELMCEILERARSDSNSLQALRETLNDVCRNGDVDRRYLSRLERLVTPVEAREPVFDTRDSMRAVMLLRYREGTVWHDLPTEIFELALEGVWDGLHGCRSDCQRLYLLPARA